MVFPDGRRQFLCKRNPTLLALISRRFIPRQLKPKRLIDYDRWYTMRDQPYSRVFPSPQRLLPLDAWLGSTSCRWL